MTVGCEPHLPARGAGCGHRRHERLRDNSGHGRLPTALRLGGARIWARRRRRAHRRPRARPRLRRSGRRPAALETASVTGRVRPGQRRRACGRSRRRARRLRDAAGLAARAVAPPPRPVVPGLYEGRTAQGHVVTFQVSSGGELSSLVLPVIDLSCSPPGGPLCRGRRTSAQRRPSFRGTAGSRSRSRERGRGGGVATYRIAVSGLLTVGIATGAVQLEVEFAASVATYTCAAPGLRWTAAAAVLTGP